MKKIQAQAEKLQCFNIVQVLPLKTSMHTKAIEFKVEELFRLSTLKKLRSLNPLHRSSLMEYKINRETQYASMKPATLQHIK